MKMFIFSTQLYILKEVFNSAFKIIWRHCLILKLQACFAYVERRRRNAGSARYMILPGEDGFALYSGNLSVSDLHQQSVQVFNLMEMV